MDGDISPKGKSTKTALMLVSAVLLSVLSFQSVLFSILTPLPHLFIAVRMGRWAGLIVMLISFVLVSVTGFNSVVGYLVQFALPGLILSELIRKRCSVEKSFVLSVSAMTFVLILMISSQAAEVGLGLSEFIKSFVESIIATSLALNEKAGVKAEHLEGLRAALPEIARVVSGLYPSLIAGAGLVMVWVNVLILAKMLRQSGSEVPFGDLSLWKAPEHLVWGVVLGGLSVLSGAEMPKVVGINLLVVMGVIYFFQGMAILSYYFRKKGYSTFLKGAAYLIAVRYMSLMVVALGLFDMWADFRRLSRPKEEKV